MGSLTPLTLSGRALALVALVVIGAMAGRFLDPDKGGYVDSFRTTITTSDKLYHAALGALLMFVLARVMPLEWAYGGVLVAGGGYEIGQGYASWRDFAADAVGALVAGGLLLVTA
jgi:hypothetical protein